MAPPPHSSTESSDSSSDIRIERLHDFPRGEKSFELAAREFGANLSPQLFAPFDVLPQLLALLNFRERKGSIHSRSIERERATVRQSAATVARTGGMETGLEQLTGQPEFGRLTSVLESSTADNAR